MKNYIKTGFLAVASILTLSSCSMKLEPYSDTNSYIAVSIVTDQWGSVEDDQSLTYSFGGLDASITEDTVYFDIYVMGNISSEDRYFSFKQTEIVSEDSEEVLNAEAGVHYVPFDDTKLSSMYCVPADSTHASVPVVLKRSDALLTDTYQLQIELTDNDYFKAAATNTIFKLINICEKLVKPAAWGPAINYYIGNYGLRKHEIMIEICNANGVTVDAVLASLNDYDSLFNFYVNMLETGLTQIEQEKGTEYITEYIEYGGKPVNFESAGF